MPTWSGLMQNVAIRPSTASANDLDTLRELNQGFIRAVEMSNARWFDANLADDFLNSNPDGSLADRAGFLAQIARPSTVTNLDARDVRVRIMGDFAIIHAQTTYTKTDGQPGMGRYTDVWARQHGRWLCVSAHVTRC